jgi:endoribonuclease Dicer
VNYIVFCTNDSYVCEVILPEKSPLRGLTGKPASRKLLAKQSAAFEMCLLLWKNGLLDNHFVSTYHKRLPAMRNARLAIKSKKTNEYDMLVKPRLWGKSHGTMPHAVHATILTLKPSRALRRPYQSLAFLTREVLPAFPPFPLFLEDDVETEVICVPLETLLDLSEMDLEILTTFTLRIFQDVFHKVYERQTEMMTYWLAPVNLQYNSASTDLNPRLVLDWTILHMVQNNDEICWTHEKPGDFLADRFVFDKWDGRYRYFTSKVESDLRPSDKPPSVVAHRRHMDNIMSYCLSLFKNARARFLETCDWSQPVVSAELVRLRRNLLDKMTEEERKIETKCYICPEPLKISVVSTLSFFFLFITLWQASVYN